MAYTVVWSTSFWKQLLFLGTQLGLSITSHHFSTGTPDILIWAKLAVRFVHMSGHLILPSSLIEGCLFCVIMMSAWCKHLTFNCRAFRRMVTGKILWYLSFLVAFFLTFGQCPYILSLAQAVGEPRVKWDSACLVSMGKVVQAVYDARSHFLSQSSTLARLLGLNDYTSDVLQPMRLSHNLSHESFLLP